MNIYVCGNQLVKEDSLPIKLIPELRKKHSEINFIEYDPTEELPKEDKLIIIDTVINAKEVMLLEDIDKFVQTKAISLHDFDLGMSLKIAKKMGWLKSVRIIGIPPNISNPAEKISKIIATLSSRSEQHSSCKGHKRE